MSILNNHYLTKELFNDPQQIESTENLYNKLNLSRIPYTPDWSASPDFLELIIDHTLQNKPMHILECSSGTSSLVLAKCCQINNQGNVTSLEHERKYADQTNSYISHFKLDNFAKIIHAPLSNYSSKHGDFLWYNIEQIPDNKIDMLVIDGPPGFLQIQSRYPAMEILYDKLASDSTVFLDDAKRDDEKSIVETWTKNFPGIRHEYLPLDRGCSILHIEK